MTDSDEVKLLPCPFCGNAPVLDDFNTSYRPNSPPSWRVMCKGPCAVELFTEGDGTREAAIAAWNTRPPVVTDELIERYPHELRISFLGSKPVKAIIEGVEFVPASELQSQSARIAELSLEVARRGIALAPFAEACSNCIDDEPDDDSTWEHPVGMEVTFRNFREARASLTKDSTSG